MTVWDMTRSFTIYDADDQKTVMKEVCKKLNIDTKIYKERTLAGSDFLMPKMN